jgi:hypothetical protein
VELVLWDDFRDDVMRVLGTWGMAQRSVPLLRIRNTGRTVTISGTVEGWPVRRITVAY